MTGYGVAEGAVAGGTLKIEIRTVNHRHLNPQIKTVAEIAPLEASIKNGVRERLFRGNVSLSARWIEEPPVAAELEVDVERAAGILAAARKLREGVDVPGDVDLAFLIRQPDVIRQTRPEEQPIDFSEVRPILNGALESVVGMREQEGSALASELTAILDRIGGQLDRIQEIAPERLESERTRLRTSVRDLLDGAEVDESRLAQELAFIADKLDVTEEIVRLGTHIGACRDAMDEDGSIGRKLSFLGQEMLREVNTIGSKANNAAIAGLVIEMKGELEKFREQVENVE